MARTEVWLADSTFIQLLCTAAVSSSVYLNSPACSTKPAFTCRRHRRRKQDVAKINTHLSNLGFWEGIETKTKRFHWHWVNNSELTEKLKHLCSSIIRKDPVSTPRFSSYTYFYVRPARYYARPLPPSPPLPFSLSLPLCLSLHTHTHTYTTALTLRGRK